MFFSHLKYQLVVFVLIGLVAFLIMMIGLQTDSTRGINTFNDSDCERSCWLGIQPNITSQSEVQNILADHNITYELSPLSLPPIGTGEGNGVYDLILVESFPLIDSTVSNPVSIYFGNNIVTRIQMRVEISLGDVITQYGSPTQSLQVDVNTIWLVYSTHKLVFQVNTMSDPNRIMVVYLTIDQELQDFFAPIEGFVEVVRDCDLFDIPCPLSTATSVPMSDMEDE